MKKVATALLLAGGLISSTAFAAKWNMPTPYGDANLPTKIAYNFADQVRKDTGGDIDIKVHSGGSLITHTEIPRAVRSGQVQLGEVFIGILGNVDPIFKHDNIPFLATSYDDAHKLWQAAKPAVEKQLDRQGMKLVYSVPWPAQGLYTKKPVHSLADLKGLKMRAYSPSTSRLADLMNTTPTTIQVPEIPQAFSTGIIDAMITSPTTGVNGQAWDYVNYYTDIQAWIPKNMVVINKRVFQRLNDKEKQAIMKAGAEAEATGWAKVRELAAKDTKTLAEHGIKVSQPSPELVAELHKIGETMTSEWQKEAPQEIDAVLKNYKK